MVGTGYTTSMSIAASITTSNPLPPNLPLIDVGPAGLKLVTSWLITDGGNIFTTANSGPFFGAERVVWPRPADSIAPLVPATGDPVATGRAVASSTSSGTVAKLLQIYGVTSPMLRELLGRDVPHLFA